MSERDSARREAMYRQGAPDGGYRRRQRERDSKTAGFGELLVTFPSWEK